MKGNNSFIFNLDWYAVIVDYPAEVRFEVYEAIMRYALSGTLTELKPLAKMAFSFIRKELDYNRQKHELISEKRRASAKSRWQRQNTNRLDNDPKTSNADSDIILDVADDTNGTSVTSVTNVTDVTNATNDTCKCMQNMQMHNAHSDSDNDLELQFETFRKQYPGIKRGFKVEFDNFKKKNPNWRDIIPLLMPALQRLIDWRQKNQAAGGFVPPFKHLSTWINQRCWTEEFPDIIPNPSNINNHATTYPNQTSADRRANFEKHIFERLASPDGQKK